MRENQFKNLLLDHTKDLIWMIDNDFKLVYANKSYLKVMKEIAGNEIILNKSVWINGLSDEYIQKWKNYYSKALKGDYFQIEEQLNHSESNKAQYNQITFEPLIGADNLIFGVSCQSKDITTLVNKRFESEQRYNALIHEGHDMIAIINSDGNYSYCNPITTSILGFGPEKFIGKNINEFIHSDDIEKVNNAIQKVISESKVVLDCIRFQNNKLEWLCMEMILTNMLENPYVKGIAINSRDITEERKLRELNRRVSEIAKVGSWEIDLENQQIYWSEEVHKMHETDPNTFIPQIENGINFFKEDFRENIQELIQKCISTGEPFDFEAVLITKNKKEIWVRSIGHAEFKDDKCKRIYGSFQNINEFKESQIRLNAFSENLPGVVYQYFIHPDGTDSLKYVSGAVEQLWGYSASEVLNNVDLIWDQIKTGKDYEAVKASILHAIETKSKWTSRFENIKPTGERNTHLASGTPVFLSDGTIMFNAIVLDITKDVKNEQLLEQISKLSKIGSWEIDIVKKTLFWSEIVHELHGTNSQSFVPDLKISLNFFRKDFRQMVKSKIKNSIKTGKPFDFEAIIVNKNNEELWTRAVGHTIFENGMCIRVIGGFQDINLRKKAEIKLHESENRFKTILEAEPECIKLLDRDGKLLMINPAGLEMIEADNEAMLLGNQVHEIVLPEHRPAFLTLIKDVLKGKSRKLIFEIKGLKGTKRWLETHAVPMRNELGTIISILAVTRDITERTTIEKEKNSLLLTLENSLNEIYIFDAETYKYSFVNKGALHNLGYLESEIKTLTPFDINSDFKIDSFNELVSPLLKGEKEKITLITNHKRKDGSVYPVEVHLQLVIEDKSKRILANILDITERKKNKELILLSNERFEKVTEATNDAIWDWDIVNQTIYRSKAFERFFGKKVPNKIIDNRFWNDNFHPDDVENFKTSLSEAVADPSITRWELEFRVINKQKKVLFVIDRGIIIRDSKGKAIRMVGAMTDITEQKQMTLELSELNEALQKYTIELERSNKELEQFAFVASHDLQEPLRMISSFMELFLRRYGHEIDDNGKKYIHFATDGAKRMKQLMLDLLQYSRASRPQEGREQIDLKEVIIEYKKLRRKVISEKSAAITYKNLPTLKTYKAAITQIMHCILDNALKYSKENSPSKIEINCQENDQEWLFSIQDNGIGIDSQFYEKIFVIFQRLHSKEAYSGTGIGLSVAKRHVEFLGGKIWLESVVGEGSTFYFTIPKTNN
ncbi:MAG: PAS domain S-box protein [Flavobacterium sp.]|nr:PAS domain S-box protein [Flavobacterium sp.]MDP5027833.1 PAS domain S-box protein [Flavobacterium sp.]